MTQEDKELLLKDLCTRLPYRVKIWVKWDKNPSPLTTSILGNYWYTVGDDFKPYLRPMSSMTSVEKLIYEELSLYHEQFGEYLPTLETYDWLNKHHFDYRGLIEKGLALEVLDGMYK